MILHRCFIFMFCFSLLNGMDNEHPKTGFKIIFSNKLNDLLKRASKLNPVSFFTKVKEEQNRLYGNLLCIKYSFIETFNSDKSDVKTSKVVFPFFDYINMPDEEKEEIFSTHPKILQKILEYYKEGWACNSI